RPGSLLPDPGNLYRRADPDPGDASDVQEGPGLQRKQLENFPRRLVAIRRDCDAPNQPSLRGGAFRFGTARRPPLAGLGVAGRLGTMLQRTDPGLLRPAGYGRRIRGTGLNGL